MMSIHKKARSLSRYLHNLAQGEEREHPLLLRDSDATDEIKTLGKIATALSALRPNEQRLNQLEQASLQRFLGAHQNIDPHPDTALIPVKRHPIPRRLPMLQRAGLALMLVIFSLISISGGIVYASTDSLPGDPLYAFKLAHENAQRYFTRSTEKQITLEENIAKKRLSEVASILQNEREVNVHFDGILYEMQPNRWIVDYLIVQIPAPTPIDGQPSPGDHVEIWAKSEPQQHLIATSIKVHGDAVKGRVQSIDKNKLIVGNLTLAINPHLYITSMVRAGDEVYVYTRKLPSGDLYAWEVEFENQTRFETRHTVYQGKLENKNDTQWLIAGRNFLITSQTHITGSFSIGDHVEAHAIRLLDEQLFAVEIAAARDDAESLESEKDDEVYESDHEEDNAPEFEEPEDEVILQEGDILDDGPPDEKSDSVDLEDLTPGDEDDDTSYDVDDESDTEEQRPSESNDEETLSDDRNEEDKEDEDDSDVPDSEQDEESEKDRDNDDDDVNN
jgi:hypothetical protein